MSRPAVLDVEEAPMLCAAAAVCVPVLTIVLVTADRSARASRARRARLYRAQVRWAAAMDHQAGRPAAAERRHVA